MNAYHINSLLALTDSLNCIGAPGSDSLRPRKTFMTLQALAKPPFGHHMLLQTVSGHTALSALSLASAQRAQHLALGLSSHSLLW